MNRIIKDSPFSIDWTDLEQVKAYCDKLGPLSCVIQVPGRPNYNITFYERAVVDKENILYRPKD